VGQHHAQLQAALTEELRPPLGPLPSRADNPLEAVDLSIRRSPGGSRLKPRRIRNAELLRVTTTTRPSGDDKSKHSKKRDGSGNGMRAPKSKTRSQSGEPGP
jgi:hypothetical protein